MFVHSVKVPRMYKIAAKILQEVKENRGSLKQLLYTNKYSNVKGIYALIVETLKHFSQIDTIIEQSQLLIKENRFDPWLARIFITELLWNEKPLAGESKPIKTIMSYHDVLKKHKLSLDSKTEPKITQKVKKPRFVRINMLATTAEQVINGFRDEEWKLVPSASQTYDEYLSKTNSLGADEFMIDLHIKELLLFPCNTEFYKHFAYRKGLIILQDKASCLPARLLNPPPGSTVLDMCAAPGMKTTHLAAVLNNIGTVYAVERDVNRFQTLNKMIETAGATCVKTINKDVLRITAGDCPNVEYILVDPSCSGSGIANRIEINDENIHADPIRLKRLTHFQARILKHAITGFPQAKRIIYSTCSVYPEENENVVRKVMYNSNFKLISAKNLLNGPWKSSESEHHDDVIDKCLYTKPEEDLTNGFFIAVFERKESEDSSQLAKAKKCENNLTVDNYQKKNAYTDEEVSLRFLNDSVVDVQENYLKRKYSDTTIAADEGTNTVEEEHINSSLAPKKKKKKSKNETKENTENSTGNNGNIVVKAKYGEEIISDGNIHKKHKKKKNKQDKDQSVNEEIEEHENDSLAPKKKKKKSKNETKEKVLDTENGTGNNENIVVKAEYGEEIISDGNIHKKHKKNKNKRDKDQSVKEEIQEQENDSLAPKKKKKKSKNETKEKVLDTENSSGNNENIVVKAEYVEEIISDGNAHKKHKKRKNKQDEDKSVNEDIIEDKAEKKKKKKKKSEFLKN